MTQRTRPKAYDDKSKYALVAIVLDVNANFVAGAQLDQYSEMDVTKIEDKRTNVLQTADLDGDGVDEVLLEVDQGGRTASDRRLEVFRVVDIALERALSVQIGYDNSVRSAHPTICDGRWAVTGDQIIVNNDVPNDASATGCPAPGTTTYVLQGGKFFKVGTGPVDRQTAPRAAAPWIERATAEADRLMRSGDGERIARAIQQIAHPTGKNPRLRATSIGARGRRLQVRISTSWQGGLTSAGYVTDAIWELDDQGHIGVRIVADDAVVGISAENARQLDDYFRAAVYGAFRANLAAAQQQ